MSTFSTTLTTTNASTPPDLSEKQHAKLLTHFLRQELSFCGMAASADLSPADIARWINSERTCTDLADIQLALLRRAHFHDLASRISAQQLLTALCHTRGRPDHLDPSDDISAEEHKSLDRATKAATALLRHAAKSPRPDHPADLTILDNIRALPKPHRAPAPSLPASNTHPALPSTLHPSLSTFNFETPAFSSPPLLTFSPTPASSLLACSGALPQSTANRPHAHDPDSPFSTFKSEILTPSLASPLTSLPGTPPRSLPSTPPSPTSDHPEPGPPHPRQKQNRPAHTAPGDGLC